MKLLCKGVWSFGVSVYRFNYMGQVEGGLRTVMDSPRLGKEPKILLSTWKQITCKWYPFDKPPIPAGISNRFPHLYQGKRG